LHPGGLRYPEPGRYSFCFSGYLRRNTAYANTPEPTNNAAAGNKTDPIAGPPLLGSGCVLFICTVSCIIMVPCAMAVGASINSATKAAATK
jgi:hypothetical protein